MTTLMPKDDNEQAIPALRLRPGGAHQITVTASSRTNTTPFAETTRVIGVYATGPVFIRTGAAGVSAAASDHFFPGGVYYDISLGDRRHGTRHSHLAAVRADHDCTLYISEKE